MSARFNERNADLARERCGMFLTVEYAARQTDITAARLNGQSA